MNEITGLQNEHKFSCYLNGSKVKSLTPIFKDLIYTLYGKKINENARIKCKVDYNKKKYDLVININDCIKKISIKKGINNSVHVEGISSFIHFLIDSGVSKENVIEYLNYHYADGTTNGTGKNRISCEEYKINNQDKIDKLNIALNNEYILKRAINRFILQGKNSNECIDAIIYGTVDDFMFITKDEIEKIILSKKYIYSTGVHFANLYCQPMTRNLNNNPKYDKKRFCVQIKWYSIFDDIIEYMNNKVTSKKM